MFKIHYLLIMLSCGTILAGTPLAQRFNMNTSERTVSTQNNYAVFAGQGRLGYNMQKYRLLKNALQQKTSLQATATEMKSPVKAALFSAMLPGAGQYYSKSYWKSALFAVIEVGALTAYVHYTNSGDTKDRQMRKIGNERWSEQRYWSKVYMLAAQGNKWDYAPLQVSADGVISDVSYNQTTIGRLREVEVNGGFPGFTHELPHTKTQQYYEMIYKYLDQFGSGWIEVGNDWNYYDSYSSLNHLLPDLNNYKKIRNESNDLYRVAFYASVSILANHIISALEAAYSLHKENERLHYSVSGKTAYYAGTYVPTLGLDVSW